MEDAFLEGESDASPSHAQKLATASSATAAEVSLRIKRNGRRKQINRVHQYQLSRKSAFSRCLLKGHLCFLWETTNQEAEIWRFWKAPRMSGGLLYWVDKSLIYQY